MTTKNFNRPNGFDGAHHGVADWYDRWKEAIVAAVESGQDFDTGSYSVKHESVSGRIERIGDTMHVTVSVFDDFDCEGVGEGSFPVSDFDKGDEPRDERILQRLEKAFDEAEEAAFENQKDNTTTWLYCVGRDEGPRMTPWSFTFLRDVSGHGFESPPGDYYHRWGWQEVDTDDEEDTEAFPVEIGAEAAAKIVAAIFDGTVDEAGKDGAVIEGWRVRLAE